MIYDIIIVGAGPVGSYAAYILARKGFKVLVLERKRSGESVPVCTGIIGKEVFDQFDVPADAILSTIDTVAFYSPSGRAVRIPFDDPPAFVVDRGMFDRDIRLLAQESGAEFRFGAAGKHVNLCPQYAEIVLDESSERLQARVIILATGPDQSLLKNLDLGQSPSWVIGAQVEAQMTDVDKTEIYLGKKIAPDGFAWVVGINNNRVRLGLVTSRNATGFLHHFLLDPRVLSRVQSIGPMASKPILVGQPQRTYSNRLLVIGEAAGQVKSTTHGGIYYGFIGAVCAAGIVQEAFAEAEFDREMLKGYEARWKAFLENEIRMGLVARKFLSCLPDKYIDNFFKLLDEEKILAKHMKGFKFDWHTEFIVSLVKQSLWKCIA